MVAGCGKKGPVLPDLSEKYSASNKKPFGAYTAHKLLENFFDNKFIQPKNQSFTQTYTELNDSSSLYISISNKLYLTSEEVNAFMEFVSSGNTVFISASFIDTSLLAAAGFDQSDKDLFADLTYKSTQLRLVKGLTNASDSFGYFYYPFANYFMHTNAENYRIVGYNEFGQPNCIVVFRGRGRLYLHCDPRAFSNYFLLTANNYSYMQQLMQLMPADPEHVYWDDYYHRYNYRKRKSDSALTAILRYPALANAFWISLALFLIYILLNGKRRQRIVPVIIPVENTSIAFAEAIAGLYRNEKNNKTIADKMIAYFNEYIRSKYFLNMHNASHEQLITLSRKSGVSHSDTESLYRAMQHAATSEIVEDYELVSLHQQIQQFHKTNN
ncbi:MAG: DUF4350 domain-containing protein [Ferruginibacter sp.]